MVWIGVVFLIFYLWNLGLPERAWSKYPTQHAFDWLSGTFCLAYHHGCIQDYMRTWSSTVLVKNIFHLQVRVCRQHTVCVFLWEAQTLCSLLYFRGPAGSAEWGSGSEVVPVIICSSICQGAFFLYYLASVNSFIPVYCCLLIVPPGTNYFLFCSLFPVSIEFILFYFVRNFFFFFSLGNELNLVHTPDI